MILTYLIQFIDWYLYGILIDRITFYIISSNKHCDQKICPMSIAAANKCHYRARIISTIDSGFTKINIDLFFSMYRTRKFLWQEALYVYLFLVLMYHNQIFAKHRLGVFHRITSVLFPQPCMFKNV